ncbi:hypothetical protein IW262DRAFT_1468486 [Armillaria fumosa]|nr:hypothetical protein IW262DRAFT_1468486 [Armillaria fumosa]
MQVARKALRVCNITLAMERFLGDIHPRAGLAIYSARVDSLLTYGSQVVVVTVDRTLRLLEKTGFTLIRYRRIVLALRYLMRQLTERGTTTRLAPLGIDACREVWMVGKKCWLTDIADALLRLYHPVHASLDDLCDPVRVASLMSDVEVLWKTEIVDEITGSPTADLLAFRYWECNGPAAAFRPYLDIRILVHRIALTRALTATHQLAVERGKSYGVSKDCRLCRVCSNDVEDVPHARYPSWKRGVRSPAHLMCLAGTEELVPSVGCFVHAMLAPWDSVPLAL